MMATTAATPRTVGELNQKTCERANRLQLPLRPDVLERSVGSSVCEPRRLPSYARLDPDTRVEGTVNLRVEAAESRDSQRRSHAGVALRHPFQPPRALASCR